MARMGMIKRGGVMGLTLLLGLATVLGGCASDKKKLDIAAQENAELRERNASLEQAMRDKDARLAELEAGRGSTAPGYDTGDSGGPTAFKPGPGGTMVAEIAGNVLFDSGSATIKSSAKKELDQIVSEIKRKYSRAGIRVEGHTDSDPIKRSKWASNDALSQARADAVRTYLNNKGVGHAESIGYGSSQPKATKAASRRVEIVILSQ